mgnify:CR=1 FL=1
MRNIDSLIKKAKEQLDPKGISSLNEDNEYLGKSKAALLDCMSGDNYKAPSMHTPEWNKFMWALINAE